MDSSFVTGLGILSALWGTFGVFFGAHILSRVDYFDKQTLEGTRTLWKLMGKTDPVARTREEFVRLLMTHRQYYEACKDSNKQWSADQLKDFSVDYIKRDYFHSLVKIFVSVSLLIALCIAYPLFYFQEFYSWEIRRFFWFGTFSFLPVVYVLLQGSDIVHVKIFRVFRSSFVARILMMDSVKTISGKANPWLNNEDAMVEFLQA